ncbi:MAG: TonB-dependent receptor [Bacteroidetes bacterium]|nr:TonB-dependent receptor [Bacteroidota bacterium]
MHLNVYGDAFGRAEINSIYTMPLKHDWNYMLMIHASGLNKKNDHNNDDFIDMPLFRQLNVYNRFHFQYGNKAEGQFGLKALTEERTGGNVNFNENQDKGTTNAYGFRVESKRMEAYSKTGFLFPDNPGTSIGIQLSGTIHDQRAYFGLQTYDGRQTSFYNNNIFVSTLGEGHTFKTGIDFKYDYYEESINHRDFSSRVDSIFTRVEAVPGAYFEYTYGKDCDKFGAILGSRIDYHNLYGWLYTPRAHLKYNFLPELILRLSAGRGYRAANTYADNLGIFVSSKKLEVLETPQIEDAWNGGVNLTSSFRLWQREGSLMVDAYHTYFVNQWISDQYSSSTSVYYYNLRGTSYASSLQGTLTYEPILRLVLKAAWRFNDVKTDYLALPDVSKPLVSKHKALFNAAFSDRDEKWRFDATLQWEGTKPLPQAAGHLHQSPDSEPQISKSPDYFQLMGQITRIFKIWEVYLGGENLLNYTQHHVILGNDNPFGDDFDATQIWGPVMGLRVYAGIRLNINSKNHE